LSRRSSPETPRVSKETRGAWEAALTNDTFMSIQRIA
jgi:hypothetical protein